MTIKGILVVLFGICIGSELFGQYVSVTGSIMDEASGKPLPYATVFVNKTTIKSTTDESGHFSLNKVPLGTYDLVIYYPGFYFHSRVVNTTLQSNLGEIELKSMNVGLTKNEDLSSKAVGWAGQYKEFTKAFLGDGELVKQSEILNPYVLSFSKESGVLRAYAREALEISNLYLGYKISFYLEVFESSRESTFIRGYTRFDEISTKGGATAFRWMQNRRQVYSGSSQHFFSSVVAEQVDGQEFSVYRVQGGSSKFKKGNFFDRVGSEIFPYDSINYSPRPDGAGHWLIDFKEKVEVHHSGSVADSPEYNDVPYTVGRIEPGQVLVNRDGTIVDDGELLVSGSFNNDELLRQLPTNFNTENVVTVERSTHNIRAANVEERVYVSFDKPYYYKGEMIWMKACMNYRNLHLRDSMSKTLYLELINFQGEIVRSQLLRIDSGFAQGNFIVPDTLTPGTYYVRAYTNLNRNFDDASVFIKPIPILSITQRVVNDDIKYRNENISVAIKPSKNNYHTRERIDISLSVSDGKGIPIRSVLAISVTDARQVVPIEEYTTIDKYFPFAGVAPSHTFPELQFPVEYGVTFNGQFVDNKGNPDKATISIVQGNFEDLSVMETEEDGIFRLGGLIFYDSVDFHFQAKDKKDRPYGRVRRIRSEPISVDEALPIFPLPIIDTESPQRLISEYEVPFGARVLEEVLIRGRRDPQKVVRPYGTPDYVVKMDQLDISSNNLMQILQGKIPGLTVRTVYGANGVQRVVRIVRASGLTILGPTEPLVMIDDVPMSGAAGDILESINVYTVESVEVITRVNPTFGSQGANGVILIYTKKGFSPDYEPPTEPMQVIKLRGYTRPAPFRFPDYSSMEVDRTRVDYRSILYWNPDLHTNQDGTASVSFYAADLKTVYRIVVEGITENNEPVRGVSYVSVNNND